MNALPLDNHAPVLLTLVLNYLGHLVPTEVLLVALRLHAAHVTRLLVLHQDLILLQEC